jgi:hypothetical protein
MPTPRLYPLVMGCLTGSADRIIEESLDDMYPTVFDPHPRVVDLVATSDGCQTLRSGHSFRHVGLADPRGN